MPVEKHQHEFPACCSYCCSRDVTGAAPIEDQRIDIEGGKIVRIQSARLRNAYPPGSRVLDLTVQGRSRTALAGQPKLPTAPSELPLAGRYSARLLERNPRAAR